MAASYPRSIAPLLVAVSAACLQAQSVPLALESPAARPPIIGSNGEKLIGMPKFHDPAPYDIDEHTGYKQIFDGQSFTGWDADPTIWRVEAGLMIGETLENKPKGNNYIVYKAEKTRDFDLKLQMKIEKVVAAASSTAPSPASRGPAPKPPVFPPTTSSS